MQISNNRTNPNFGTLDISKAKTLLDARKIKAKDVEELEKLINHHKKNPVIVTLDEIDGKLHGMVWCEDFYYKDSYEGFWDSIFSSPLKFIRSLCSEAGDVWDRKRISDSAERLSNSKW